VSEERRAAPAPKPHDSAGGVPPALGPDSTTTEVAPVPSTPTLSDSEPPPASRSGARDSSPGRRRGRTTLRIPDDEVTRPKLPGSDGGRDSAPPPSVAPVVTVDAPSPAPAAEAAVMLMPMRIISINPTEGAPMEPPPPEMPPSPPAPHLMPEDSWTPFQPTVIDDAPTDGKLEARPRLASEELSPIDTDLPPAAESVPESLEPDDIEPAKPTPVPPPPPRALAPTEPEGEEVKFDEDAPTPALPAVTYVDTPPSSDSERRSDPGAEIAAEDLVAVEPLPPMRQRLASQPPVPPVAARKQSVQPLPPIKSPLVIVPPHVGTGVPQSGEGSGLRRKGRLWWEDLFNDDYLRTCEKLSDEQIAREVDFVEDSLGIERGGAVLDLACGTGRHTIELARRGYEVVGFDLSLAMLARAGEDAQDHDAKVNFVQGDMREMTFDEQFDGVFCWNTSFGFFEEEKNALVIDRIHHSLRAGGLFLLDVINRDFLIRQSPSLAWFEGDGCVCMDEMNVDFITSRMKIKRTMMLDDGRSREIEYSMRVYSLHELGKILHDHGFKVCEVSGRVATPGVFFGNESPRTIILAEKR
jgi:SAM-dependent methyltransferase